MNSKMLVCVAIAIILFCSNANANSAVSDFYQKLDPQNIAMDDYKIDNTTENDPTNIVFLTPTTRMSGDTYTYKVYRNGDKITIFETPSSDGMTVYTDFDMDGRMEECKRSPLYRTVGYTTNKAVDNSIDVSNTSVVVNSGCKIASFITIPDGMQKEEQTLSKSGLFNRLFLCH